MNHKLFFLSEASLGCTTTGITGSGDIFTMLVLLTLVRRLLYARCIPIRLFCLFLLYKATAV
jgi:hypothetical protein